MPQSLKQPFFLIGVAMMIATSAHASGAIQLLPGQIQAGYDQSVQSLRQEALDQQQRDGGTLTDAHMASFQKRYAGLTEHYRQILLHNNPYSVSADGTARAPSTVAADWTATRSVDRPQIFGSLAPK
ncbi:hypothetical protein [Sphingomonas oryzagri]|uniref:Uncharacterized protein n=1 Tax=Sphingomonas oryzagri TaxID=3042314 RepID=A0ABT6MW93_9SPHN|nr:hypothetical protein [Sphingomonas oryzagri]MDH7637304.1 hypothetical protein [Sphingomonas oryzagri]